MWTARAASNVKFIGGCSGNLQGISRLVEGKKLAEVSETLKGIKCRNNTSCPDQLAHAIAAYKEREGRPRAAAEPAEN